MSSYVTDFFSTITRNQFNNVVATLKGQGAVTASTRKRGTGPQKRISDEARDPVKDLAVLPVRQGATNKRHFSQREIARHLNISKTIQLNRKTGLPKIQI